MQLSYVKVMYKANHFIKTKTDYLMGQDKQGQPMGVYFWGSIKEFKIYG